MVSDLTVVVPLYNGAKTIAETLESLQRQTLPVAEVIVVDDGSSDDGPQIAAAHRLAPRVIRQPRNLGVAIARNTGLIEARSGRVAFVDQDDLWLPARHERLAATLERLPEDAALVTTEQVFATTEERSALDGMDHAFTSWIRHWRPAAEVLSLLDEAELPAQLPKPKPIPLRRLLEGSVTITTSYVLPRRLSLQVGGFASWVRSADDWVLLQTLGRFSSVYRLDDPSVLYRVHPSNTSVSTDWQMPLLLSAAAIRYGRNVVGAGLERDPEQVGRLGDSAMLSHQLSLRATTPGWRSRVDAWAAWQLLATDRADRVDMARRLARLTLRSWVPGWLMRPVRAARART